MGKAQIISGGTGGLYAIKILYDRARATARIAKIDAAVASLDTILATLASELAAQQSAYEAAKTTSPAKTFAELAAMASAINAKKAKLDLYLVERASKKATKRQLQAIPVDPNASAWCADLTTNLSGNVGTIEPNGEPAGYIIRPGYQGGAVFNAARDGQVQPVLANTPEGTFVNKALMPGWQKWRPTIRIGTINTINTTAHTCSLTLDTETSRERPAGPALDINQGLALANVPIQYMTCNSGAFAVGDRVVVEFTGQNFNAPKVIGFESNPKACGPESVVVYVYFATGTKAAALVWNAETDAVEMAPIDDSDPAFAAWLAAHTDVGTDLFGPIPWMHDKTIPYKINPELVDTADTVYHIDGYVAGTRIYPESVYTADNLPPATPIKYSGLRTQRVAPAPVESIVYQYQIGKYWYSAPTESWIEEKPSYIEEVDYPGYQPRFGHVPPGVEPYYSVDYIGLKVTSVFTATYGLYGPVALIGQHLETLTEISNQFFNIFEWLQVYVPWWPPSTSESWTEEENYRKGHQWYNSTADGSFSNLTIANVFVVMFTPWTEHFVATYGHPTVGVATHTKGARVVQVQAQIVNRVAAGSDWKNLPVSANFQTAIKEAIELAYTLNEVPVDEERDCIVSVHIFAPK